MAIYYTVDEAALSTAKICTPKIVGRLSSQDKRLRFVFLLTQNQFGIVCSELEKHQILRSFIILGMAGDFSVAWLCDVLSTGANEPVLLLYRRFTAIATQDYSNVYMVSILRAGISSKLRRSKMVAVETPKRHSKALARRGC